MALAGRADENSTFTLTSWYCSAMSGSAWPASLQNQNESGMRRSWFASVASPVVMASRCDRLPLVVVRSSQIFIQPP